MPAGTRTIETARVYAEHIAPKARRYTDTATTEYLLHRSQWCVLAALLLLGLEMLVQERMRERGGGAGKRQAASSAQD